MIELELDIGADQAAQQVGRLAENLGEIEHLRLQRLLARKRQKLADEIGGPVSVLLDLLDIREGLIAGRVAQQQQIAEPDHGRQQIIEIMRDAARELADQIHLLGLEELGLKALLFGQIEDMDDQPRALFAGLVGASDIERSRDIALGGEADFYGGRQLLVVAGAVEPVQQRIAVLGADETGEGARDGDIGLAADDPGKGRIAFGDAPVSVEQDDTDRRVVEEPVKAFLRDPHGIGKAPLARQVTDQRTGVKPVDLFLRHHGLGDIGVEQFAVAAQQRRLAQRIALLAGERRMGRTVAAHGLGQQVRQRYVARQEIVLGTANPFGEGRVDIKEPPVLIDRIEADGGVLDELDQLFLFGPDHALKLIGLRDIVDRPDHVFAGHGYGKYRQPRELDPRQIDFQIFIGRLAARGGFAQPLDAPGGADLDGERRQPVERLFFLAHQLAPGLGHGDEPAVGPGDQACDGQLRQHAPDQKRPALVPEPHATRCRYGHADDDRDHRRDLKPIR